MKKYHFGFKVLAFWLAACALLAGFWGVALTATCANYELYSYSPEDVASIQLENQFHNRASMLAYRLLDRYTAIHLGQCDPGILRHVGRDYTAAELSRSLDLEHGHWDYRISDLTGAVMESNYSGKISGDIHSYTFSISVQYPIHTISQTAPMESWIWRDYYYTETQEHFLYYYNSPTYLVTIRMLPDALSDSNVPDSNQLSQLYAMRYWGIGALVASIVIFILCFIYLCFAAGRSHRHDETRLKGLTRLPLDLYGAVSGLLCVGLVSFGLDFADNILWDNVSLNWVFYLIGGTGSLFTAPVVDRLIYLIGGVGALFAAALITGLWLYALMAQIKMKGGYWWRHSAIGWCLKKLWNGIKFCFRAVRKLFRLLPLIWQWLLTALAMMLMPLLLPAFDALSERFGFYPFVYVIWFLYTGVINICVICYGAYAFGLLLKGAKQMRNGDLHAKIPTKYLFGAFRDFAEQLNSLADAAMESARNQMKSERMKTELITNVSHDIKTPLTSLINYVDLLEKPHTEEEGQQYLEVLSRQSQRLKKLIDDLMEMSKANSGAMNVDIAQVDAVEVLNQALGEFADKLEKQNLTVLFSPPAEPVMVYCDGRLTWRVMSNLLSNIVKYALSGTRVYVDLNQTDELVSVSFKNISREALNVSAEELTERFVRGDASRNTEGSGLGLNIAQSLMQLQQGDLQLFVDGDLFKVTLTFPAAE